jgi:L-threonylcarbamoyladenylate synthase
VARHYAPRARLVLVEGARAAEALAAESSAARAGALLITATCAGMDHVVRMPGQPHEYARRLYAALHELDRAGCEVILVEEPPSTTEWTGVRDRLLRGSAR